MEFRSRRIPFPGRRTVMGDLVPTAVRTVPGEGVKPLGAYIDRVLSGRQLRLGSRRSPMAMAQARQVRHLLTELVDGLTVEVVGIETSGDTWQGDLAELGGKGAFLKSIDKALVA